MKYGIREICDVVFRAKGACKVGNRIFYKDEPIMYFDTLKTSSLEAASASVYAQGGRGNPRLIAWDGDRTLTFNMEDALISSEGLQILSGAGLMEASSKTPLRIHSTSQLSGNDIVVTTATNDDQYVLSTDTEVDSTKTYYQKDGETGEYSPVVTPSGNPSQKSYYEATGVIKGDVKTVDIYLPKKPYWPTYEEEDTEYYSDSENYIYVFPLDEYGEVWTEPFIPDVAGKKVDEVIIPSKWVEDETDPTKGEWADADEGDKIDGYKISLKTTDDLARTDYKKNKAPVFGDDIAPIFKRQGENVVLVDYYTTKTSMAQQIDITADKFGGTYYIEGDTLFRTQQGIDMPAEFIIPNGKIQSNFTFSMAATGDPSTFTFTVDAMPDYTRFDKNKKVLAAIQIIQDAVDTEADRERTYTAFPGRDPSVL